MVRIRLRRMGAKKKPTYRIVVADKRSPRDGRFIEVIGSYNPRTEPETVNVKIDRAAHWLSVGAQPSDAVARMLRKVNLLDENGKPIPLIDNTDVDTIDNMDVDTIDNADVDTDDDEIVADEVEVTGEVASSEDAQG